MLLRRRGRRASSPVGCGSSCRRCGRRHGRWPQPLDELNSTRRSGRAFVSADGFAADDLAVDRPMVGEAGEGERARRRADGVGSRGRRPATRGARRIGRLDDDLRCSARSDAVGPSPPWPARAPGRGARSGGCCRGRRRLVPAAAGVACRGSPGADRLPSCPRRLPRRAGAAARRPGRSRIGDGPRCTGRAGTGVRRAAPRRVAGATRRRTRVGHARRPRPASADHANCARSPPLVRSPASPGRQCARASRRRPDRCATPPSPKPKRWPARSRRRCSDRSC